MINTVYIGPCGPAVSGDQWFASRPAPDCGRYLLGVPVPGLLPHDGTLGAPIWTEDQPKDIMAGISEVFLEYGWRMWQARQARIDAADFGPTGIPPPQRNRAPASPAAPATPPAGPANARSARANPVHRVPPVAVTEGEPAPRGAASTSALASPAT